MRSPYKTPRKAYCTGCGIIFPSIKKLLNHRGSHRCGGRFLSCEEHDHLMRLRLAREAVERELRTIRTLVAS